MAAADLVLNETDYVLDHQQMLAIEKGVTFIRSSMPSRLSTGRALQRFHRSINLQLHWACSASAAPQKSLLSRIVPSKWCPPNILSRFNPLWSNFENLIQGTNQRPRRAPNINTATLAAWDDLTKDGDFFLIRADKGGKLVLWPRADYYLEAHRQLSDDTTYERLDGPAAADQLARVKLTKQALLGALYSAGKITSDECSRVGSESVALPNIYFLPKAHKPERPYRGRPIIAATNSVMKSLDVYITTIVGPLLPLIPGTLDDSPHLIRELEALPPQPAGSILFSADVESLYPSIPWTEGIAAAVRFYSSHFHVLTAWATQQNLLPPPKPALFKRILETILHNNIFDFRCESYYKQRKGIAMGSSISVYVAKCFMYYRTRDLIHNPPTWLTFFKIYIDDIIAITSLSPAEIPALFSNVVDEHIKLTYVFAPIDGELAALDLLVKLKNQQPSVRLYRKPTDGHQFVHWTSSHPRHLLESLPYSQLLRYKRNCTSDEDFQLAAAELLARFRQRGYPEDVLARALARVNARSRAEVLLKSVTPVDDDTACFVTLFNQDNDSAIKAATRNFWSDLQLHPIVANISEAAGRPALRSKVRVSYRTAGSLGSCLIPNIKRPC